MASFGPQLNLGKRVRLRPLYALYDVLPAFDAVRVPGRFGILVMTGVAVLAGLGAAAIARRIRGRGRRTVTLGALAALAALEAWSVPIPFMRVAPHQGPADAWLAARPGPEAVVVLPMHERPVGYLESLRLLGSTAHWRPLVNGYGGVYPPGYFMDIDTLNAFPSPASVARLRAL